MFLCSMCDGPAQFIGDSAFNLELLPANKRSLATFSKVEIPYAVKLLDQELSFFMNIGMRMLTDKDVKHLRGAPLVEMTADQIQAALTAELPDRVVAETEVPEMIEKKEDEGVRPEDLVAMGFTGPEDTETAGVAKPMNTRVLNAAMEAAMNAVVNTTTRGDVTAQRLNSVAVNAAVNAAMAAAREAPLDASGITAPTSSVLPQNMVFTPANTSVAINTARLAQAPTSTSGELEEADLDAMPEGAPIASEQQPGTSSLPQIQQQPVVMTGGSQASAPVNVQTSTQPVLVVPLNVGQAQAPAAQYLPPPVGGAPPTFAVDTSEQAMAAAGLSSGYAPQARSRAASRSASPGTRPRAQSGANSSGNSAALSAPNVKVNVVKQG
jgi:hypothetical protein